jgi:hypothetical protein
MYVSADLVHEIFRNWAYSPRTRYYYYYYYRLRTVAGFITVPPLAPRKYGYRVSEFSIRILSISGPVLVLPEPEASGD